MSLLLDKSFYSIAKFLDEILDSREVDSDMKSKALKVKSS